MSLLVLDCLKQGRPLLVELAFSQVDMTLSSVHHLIELLRVVVFDLPVTQQ